MERARSSSLVVASVVFFVSAFVAIVSACSVDVDLSNKGCPCPDGLVCDPATNTCVTTLPAQTTGDAGIGPPPAACNDADCKCEINEDCRDPKRPYCGPSKTCVECVTAPADTCTAGGYCNEQNQCVVGCKTGDDCQNGQKCQLSTHRCVDCIVDQDCTAASPTKKCSPSGTCAEACTGDDTPCGTGGTCCSGLCLVLTNDVLNCGQCGKACSKTNATPSCNAGVCTWECANGYGHCKPPGENSGCETNIRNADNCGACDVKCTSPPIVFTNGVACAGDKCTYTTCQQGHYDKDRNPGNGCEEPCGAKNQTCCPAPQMPCANGGGCKPNGTCN